MSMAALPARGNAVEECAGPAEGYRFPIVLRGVPELQGADVGRIAAWRFAEGHWARVPLQVDEVNGNGDYVLDQGMPFTANTGDGVFSTRDELSVDGSSLGADFQMPDVPPALTRDIVSSWRVRLCRGGRLLGAILIARTVRALPEVSAVPAVLFDKSLGRVTTSLYRYDFHAQSPVLLGQVFLRKDATEVPALADSMFRMPLVLPWWLPNFTLRNEDFKSMIECWRVGPVRAIVAVGVKFRSFLSLLNLHLFSELVFYRNRFEIPTVIEFIFDPGTYLRRGSGLMYSLRYPPGRAWKVTSNLVDLPAARPADVALRASDSGNEPFFASGSSEFGAFRVEVRVDESARRLVPPPFLIRDSDFDRESPKGKFWPWLRDSSGDLGVFLDISGVRKGIYRFGLEMLLSDVPTDDFGDRRIDKISWEPAPASNKGP